MASKKNEVVLERMTQAATEGRTVPLGKLKLRPELFRHREDAELSPAKLQGLYDSLIVSGQEEPVEVARIDGELVVIKGHRRLACFHLMIERKVEGVTLDTPVLVKEVKDFDKDMIDLVARSINDNVNRETVTELARIKAALKLRELGAREERVRVAVGVSETTLARYYRLGDNRWMLDHVVNDEIRLTDAHSLLEAAVNQGKAAELREDLAAQVSRVKVRIEELEAKRLEEKNEALGEEERKVKAHVEPHEVETWLVAVKKGQRLAAGSKWMYKAVVEEKRKGLYALRLPAVSIDLVGAEHDRVVTVKERLEKVLRELRPHLKRLEADREINAERLAEEAAESKPPAPTAAEPVTRPDPNFGSAKPRRLADPLAGVELPSSGKAADKAEGGE